MTDHNTTDNLVSHISRVSIGDGVSAKTGNPYYFVEFVWILPDGKTYTQRAYLNNESLPLVQMSVSAETASAL